MTPRELLQQLTSYEISEYYAGTVIRRTEEKSELENMVSTMGMK